MPNVEPLLDYDDPIIPPLPPNRSIRAILIGVIAGIATAAVNVIITLVNAPMYQAATTHPDKLPANIAGTIAGLACLTFLVGLLIYYIAGSVTGKVVVERRMGFVAGFVAGAVTYLASFLKQYIPNYPGNIPASGSGSSGATIAGIVVILVFLLVSGAIGGLVGLLGARIATRRHPYYYLKAAE